MADSTEVRQVASIKRLSELDGIVRCLAALFLAAASVAPLAAQSAQTTLAPAPAPVKELPGAGRPVDRDATQARRERLLGRIGKGVIAVPAAKERDLEADVLQDNDFRQDDYFFYLTGVETPDAWLVMASGGEAGRQVVLLLPDRDPSQERWTGLKLGPGADAERLTGIARSLSAEKLDSVVRVLARASGGPLYTTLDAQRKGEQRVTDWVFSGRDVRNVVPALDSMRIFKDPAELARLRRAIQITTQAQRAAMQAVKPALYEYQLEATIEYTFRNLGADRLGFPSIVGSGPNSTTLHYDANRRQMQDGDLVVADIGAEYGQYTADVTRTFPVNGKFTERQKAIYNLVLATQQAAIDAVKPGITVGELHRLAAGYMREHSGTLCGAKNCTEYFVHGLSHWLGMRVHDVGDYRTPLGPGAVITVEPGIYLPEESLGVRIEDDVLVTDTGHEVLSADAPRAPQEIEALMKR